MFLSSLILKSLLMIVLLDSAHCRRVNCKDRCCSFVESFPVRLKELRTSFSKIREYYEANDELETALLDETVLHNIKSPFGCHAMNDILRFYLDTVLPTAVKTVTEDNSYFKSPIDSIGNIFKDLKKEVLHCRNYFSCIQPFGIDTITASYKKMEGNGLYKAMGELDLLFNYIEDYLVSKRKKN